jgi:serine/threonine protein kinase HipA of HipAB toxin-antitoxin module
MALATISLSACGDSDQAAPPTESAAATTAADDGQLAPGNRALLIEAMVSEGGTREDAECLVDALGADAERLWNTPDEDLTEEESEQFFAAAEKCM